MMRSTNGLANYAKTAAATDKRLGYSAVVNRQAIERIAQVNDYIDSVTSDELGEAGGNDLRSASSARRASGPRQRRDDAHQRGGPLARSSSRSGASEAALGARRQDEEYEFEEANPIGSGRHHRHQLRRQQDRLHHNQREEDDDGEEDEAPTPPHQERHLSRLDQLGEDSASSSELEEVYLCSCCGVTKQLEPAMKYLPVFRSLFYLFNFLSFAFAFALLGFGLWFRIDPKVYELHKYIETQNFTIAGWIMLFGGFLICLLTLSGHRAAGKKAVRSLIFYCFIMTMVTIAFIGTLVLLTVHGLGTSLERFMSKEIYDQIRRRAMSTEIIGGEDATQFLDFVQVKLRCCGSVDFRDYQKLGMVMPATCYTIPNNYIMAPGCAEAIRRLFDLRAGLATGFTAASVMTQLMAMIFASLIVCTIYNYRAQPRPASAASTVAIDQTLIKTPLPPQFEKQSRAREYERHSRPGSRSSIASIRV